MTNLYMLVYLHLLSPNYNFNKQKSENWYNCLYISSCCQDNTIFIIKKEKICTYNKSNIPAVAVLTFTIQKTKTAKDIFDEKTTTTGKSTVGRTAPALQFFKQKNKNIYM